MVTLRNTYALHLSGQHNSVDVTNVPVIYSSDPLLALELKGLSGGVDGQVVYLIANNGANILVENNQSIDDNQPFQTCTGIDVALPALMNEVGCAVVIYDAIITRWMVIPTS